MRRGPQKSSLIQPGEDLNDDYRVGELLAVEGGMGLIYVVSHKRLTELQLVLKVLPSDSPPDMIARMEREAYALSKLSTSRYVVRIQDSGHCKDGMPYIVMDRLTGPHLGKLLQQEGRLDIQRGVGLGMQASLGLHSCHVEGISHRDIKPANVMLHHDAQAHEIVKLIDFGISHVLVGPAITALDKRSGTRRYMPPEQSLGNDDERADQFSLAAVLFETLAGPGQLPWPTPKKDDGAAHERFVAAGNYRRLRDLRPDAPEELEGIIRKALSPNPDDRFTSMHAFARELVIFADVGSRVLFDQYIVTVKSSLTKGASVLTGVEVAGANRRMEVGPKSPAHDDSDYATVQVNAAKTRGRGLSRFVANLGALAFVGLGIAWVLRESGVRSPSGVEVIHPDGKRSTDGHSSSSARSVPKALGAQAALPESRQDAGENDGGGSRIEMPPGPEKSSSIHTASASPAADTSHNVSPRPLRQEALNTRGKNSAKKPSVQWVKGRPYSAKGTAIVE